MSRDYSTRSRSRSRERRNARPDEMNSYQSRGEPAGLLSSRTNEDKLAEDLGYSTAGWGDQLRASSMGSLSQWGSVRSQTPPPPPGPPGSTAIPAAPRPSESEDWGYTPKPYVPQAIPLNMPILANPVVHPPPPPPPTSLMPDGAHLVLENVPADVNIMSLLYEHFKQFGDVSSIHCIPRYNKALVDFKSREVAELAAADQVLGLPLIRASVYNGPARGMGRTPVIASSSSQPPKPAGAPMGLTKNLVLESEAARKTREKRERQTEADKKRIELLTAYTEHVKQIVAKLADKSLKEEIRAKYQEMLESVKSKISDLQKIETERRRKEQEVMQKALSLRYKAYEKQARLDSNKRQQELTLDLRSRCVKISELPEELSQSIVLVEYLRAMGMKELEDVIWLDQRAAAVLRFANHAASEQLIKHELAFKADWVSNEEANNLSLYNEVEKVEILPLDDEEEAAFSREHTPDLQ